MKPMTRTLATGLGVAGGVAAITRAFHADLQAARARLAGRSRVVTTALGPVEVAEAGSGPPVLVIHGAAGGFDMGLQIGLDVLGEGYRVIAPSRFGYLRSPMPTSATQDDQADLFAAMLDELDAPRVAVIGISAGAQSATRLALRHPDRVSALVLVTPALYLPPEPGTSLATELPGLVFDHLLGSDFVAWLMVRLAPVVLVRVAGVPPALDEQVTPELREHIVDWYLPAAARQLGLSYDMRTMTPTAPDLPVEELAMPVLLVGSADDPYKTGEVVQYSAPRIPDVTLLVLASGGHVLVGQDQRMRDEVQGFLRAHP
jgi:pimeloyl-ACP methyl ester carboxylesterase